jgi:chromate reductase, NAD(P)H dehydrogenase (quinone)
VASRVIAAAEKLLLAALDHGARPIVLGTSSKMLNTLPSFRIGGQNFNLKLTAKKGLMIMDKNIAVIVGSLRKDSINLKVSKALVECAPSNFKLIHIEIGKMPVYNPDEDTSPPATWTEFRNAVSACDAVLFVTPEYNRSVPSALKNAIDVGSRPYGKSVWDKKPGAIVSASPGAIGGFGANHHLRQSLVFLNIPTMAQPEAYIGGADKLFDARGVLNNEDTRKFLTQFMQSFSEWIAANSK